MRNITVCIPDEIYRQARICAAHRGLSVSALVRRFLESLLEWPSPAEGTKDRTLNRFEDPSPSFR